jgi:NTP pyrophosphatase (non-canonical NTP hydrolase)
LAIQVESLTERNEIEMLGLATSEIGEAMEAVRKGGPDDHLPMFDGDIVEAADAIIRLMDYAASQAKSGELGEAIVYKLRYNRLRPHKHGKKA